MTLSLTVDELDVDDPAWRAMTERATGTSPFHHPARVKAAAAGTGSAVVALGAWRGRELVGGIAAIRTAGGAIHPRSMAAYNGPLLVPMVGAHPRARHRHEVSVSGALLGELVTRHPRTRIRLRPCTFDVRGLLDSDWTLSASFTYHLDLTDLDLTWRRIDANRRRLVRRATQCGLSVREVHEPSSMVVEHLAGLHAQQQASYGAALDLEASACRYSIPMLLSKAAARLFVVDEPAGQVVAFALVTSSTPTAAVMLSGADHSWLDSGAAALLRWETVVRLAADGVIELDLNGARTGSHGRFKASFGGELVERWELSPPPAATWRSLPKRLARHLRNEVRATRSHHGVPTENIRSR